MGGASAGAGGGDSAIDLEGDAVGVAGAWATGTRSRLRGSPKGWFGGVGLSWSGPVRRKGDLEVVGGGLDCGAVKRVAG